MFKKIILLFHTIKYLKFIQVYYRLYYFIQNRFFPNKTYKTLNKKVEKLVWSNFFLYDNSSNNNQFTFLNITHNFSSEIDWNYGEYGKLWTYNLNYFDFLNQKKIAVDKGLELIHNYIENDAYLKDGKEPYPISLRGINWIKFISIHTIFNEKINQNLYIHYQILLSKLEYHLLGNHLLENGFSLFFGAYYFKDATLYKKAMEILNTELVEQTLNDGAHYELSPMYHQLILYRILDCLQLEKLNSWKGESSTKLLKNTAINMLGWLDTVTYNDGSIPMVNDCANNIAPPSKILFSYAKELGLSWNKTKLKESGYRKFSNANFELFIDVGNIGPTYQPGHAHADTFNFELYINEKPFFVETGTSTYENNTTRQIERSTSSHNTVTLNDKNQSDVWGGFRVGKRAKIIKLEEKKNSIKSAHNGYANIHQREFSLTKTEINITDTIKSNNVSANAYFHLHPAITSYEISKNSIFFLDLGISLVFDSSYLKIHTEKYLFAKGFNDTTEAIKFKIQFKNTLITTIQL